MHKDGHMMIICTGRSLKELEIAMKDYPIPFDYAVLNNGGHIINERYETLYEKTIDRQAGIDILNLTTFNKAYGLSFVKMKGHMGIRMV